MNKATLIVLAAGAFLFSALPVHAQQNTATQQVQKEKQKLQGTQAATNPTSPVKKANPATGGPSAVQPAAVTPVSRAVAPTPPPAIPLTCTWDVVDYDFGKNVVLMKPASATYTLTNGGKDPVTITQVSTSCGCTAPKYTKEPIKPGEKGEVTLTYNSAVSGFFSKSAQVTLNDGQRYQLTIKGEVQKVEPQPAPAAVK